MNHQDQLQFLLDFLRFPSVSTEPDHAPAVRACAEWLRDALAARGFAAELVPTAGHPIVVARTPARPGRPTVLVYGHYDVQPANIADGWTRPPFEPTIVDGVLFARGATDNKGQIAAHLLGAAALLSPTAADGPPVNLIFLIEGEEEIGSPNLRPFLERHRQELRCDAVVISDTGMLGPDLPTLTYGTRGIAALEVVAAGPAHDLHSGIFGGAIANPCAALADLLAALHHPDGRIAIPGFYDDVVPLAPWERAAWAQLPITDADLRQAAGVTAFWGEPDYTPVERIWGRPTAELNGLGGGFQGVGSKTVIPREAFAKLTFRLVPDQDPDRIGQLVKAFIESRVPPAIRFTVTLGHGGRPFVMDPSGRWGTVARRALEQTFAKPVALIREGGTIPILHDLREILAAEVLLLGLALPNANAHGPDENFPLANFAAGIRLHQAFLELAAAL